MKKSIYDISLLPSLPPLSPDEKRLLSTSVDVDQLYSLSDEVRQCTSCVITNQRPRIIIGPDGVCNPCRYWEKKSSSIDWNEREALFKELCHTHRSNDGSFDVLVPSSGGKDSSYVAYVLKEKYNMNPLTVTWAPALPTEIGFQNFHSHIQHGLNNIMATADGLIHRRLCRSSTIIMGDPFQPFVYGQVNIPLRIAKAYDIGLIVDGENGEVEYGGDDSTEDLTGFTRTESEIYWQSGMEVSDWLDYGFTPQELNFYKPPREAVQVQRVFFSFYHNWRPHDHFYYVSEKAGFHSNPERSECTYSRYASLDDAIDPFHYFFALLKFGIGRATSDAAHEIREKIIDREEGIALVDKYDRTAPSAQSTQIFLKYTSLTPSELIAICKRWTNSRIWSNNPPPKINF